MAAARIGIDLGGSKTEIIILSETQIIWRKREPTPAASYAAILRLIVNLVQQARAIAPAASVGVGMPGAVTDQGRIKNANTVCLNGQPFRHDLEKSLACDVRVMNDANCFALSEAIDGAASADPVVFAVIIGTGVGGGLVINRQLLEGRNRIAGEWGHNPLCKRASRSATAMRRCYCGKNDCVETFLSGAGLQQSSQELLGETISGIEISHRLKVADHKAQRLMALYAEQLAASLAVVINIVDPHVVVLGGGLSNLPGIAAEVQQYLPRYVFSDTVKTRIVVNHHGDSSGVRGAAWLWPDLEFGK